MLLYFSRYFSSSQSLSCVQFFATPWTVAHQAPLSSTISWSLCKLMSIDESYLVMSSNHLILCHPLLLLPSIFPSIRVFSKDLALCIRWPKYWSFSISFSNEYSGLILLRIDWFDILAVQGTLQNLLQYHSLKASIFWCSWLDTITDTMDMNLSKLQEIVEDRGAWHTAVHGVAKSWRQLSD